MISSKSVTSIHFGADFDPAGQVTDVTAIRDTPVVIYLGPAERHELTFGELLDLLREHDKTKVAG